MPLIFLCKGTMPLIYFFWCKVEEGFQSGMLDLLEPVQEIIYLF